MFPRRIVRGLKGKVVGASRLRDMDLFILIAEPVDANGLAAALGRVPGYDQPLVAPPSEPHAAAVLEAHGFRPAQCVFLASVYADDLNECAAGSRLAGERVSRVVRGDLLVQLEDGTDVMTRLAGRERHLAGPFWRKALEGAAG